MQVIHGLYDVAGGNEKKGMAKLIAEKRDESKGMTVAVLNIRALCTGVLPSR